MRSKSRSAKPDRPFDAALLARAREVVDGYNLVIHREDGAYYGRALEMPGVMADGPTPAKCLQNTMEILVTSVATLLEAGRVPPLPASDERRDEQVNVRLTKLEKATFEDAARSRGFRGLSDFIRSAALSSIS